MKTAAELVSVISASNRDLENWVSRLDLGTSYQQPERGYPRLFSKINAFELGMIAALTRGGASPSSALSLARLFVLDAKNSRLEKWKRWFVFPAGDLKRGIGTNVIDPDAPSIKGLDATTLSIVDVRRLVDGINQLYSED